MCVEGVGKSLPKKDCRARYAVKWFGAEAMSEFKFACPVCGQHITADGSTSGGQIDCPTCFQKIVVPQAPASQDTKLILSAAQVAKPRPVPSDAASQLGPLPTSPSRSSILALIILLILIGGAGAALFAFRDQILKAFRGKAPVSTNAIVMSSNVPVAFHSPYPVPTNITWTLDLTNSVFPEETAVGRIHGHGFLCEKAILRGGLLSLGQGKGPWDLAVSIHLFARQGEELSGKTLEVFPTQPHSPRVVLRWKNELRKSASETIRSGYALRLVFEQAAEGRMPGKIYLCLPDAAKSFVAGTFTAEIKKPLPPKGTRPPPPKPKPPAAPQ